MKPKKILGLGEVVVDWVAQVPHFPRPDEKIDALSENRFSGGVTANFLVAVSRLGAPCGFIGAVGDDPYGNFLIEDFQNENVETVQTLRKVGKRTPVNFIFVSSGEKTIIQSPHMQTTKLEPNDLDENYIKNAELLHTTLIHPDLAQKAFKIAKENEVKISIDLESQIARRGWKELENFILKADVLIPNKEGAKTITECDTPEEAAKVLIKKGVPIVIITMGAKGVLITTEEGQSLIPACKIDKIIDTTGAGDTFNGAFSVAYWIKKWDLEKSCKFANAAAALKIRKLGARTGMPNEADIRDFLKINEGLDYR